MYGDLICQGVIYIKLSILDHITIVPKPDFMMQQIDNLPVRFINIVGVQVILRIAQELRRQIFWKLSQHSVGKIKHIHGNIIY